MMERQSAQDQLFYSFRFEDHIPGDHLLRKLDLVLNFDRVRSVLSGHYSSTGRPSIDPELMLRMLLVGYVYGIRSERQLRESSTPKQAGFPEWPGWPSRFAGAFS